MFPSFSLAKVCVIELKVVNPLSITSSSSLPSVPPSYTIGNSPRPLMSTVRRSLSVARPITLTDNRFEKTGGGVTKSLSLSSTKRSVSSPPGPVPGDLSTVTCPSNTAIALRSTERFCSATSPIDTSTRSTKSGKVSTSSPSTPINATREVRP